MPIVAWLKENSGPFKNSGIRSYYQGGNLTTESGHQARIKPPYFFYYYSPIDVHTLHHEIQKISGTIELQNAIAERDKKTGQNALHFLLSNKVYGDNAATLTEQTILICQASSTLHSKYTNKYQHYFDEQSTVFVSIINDFVNNNLRLQPKTIAHRIEEQQPLMIKTLLQPFSKHDTALTDVLLCKDKQGDTPLHCAFKKLSSYTAIEPLLRRIATLKNIEEIVLAEDATGQTIFHCIAQRWYLPQFAEIFFGKSILKKAFAQSDYLHNTPLHQACTSRHQRLKKITAICHLLTPSIQIGESSEEDKSDCTAVMLAYQQNSSGENPLHLACQTKTASLEDDIHTAVQLKKTAAELFTKKIMEQDQNGNTPLHHAIESGNVTIVEELMNGMYLTDKLALLTITNNKHETALHAVCRYGNRRMLEVIVDALGPKAFYQLRKEKNNPANLLAKNPHLTLADYNTIIKKYNSLFDGVEYFLNRKKRFSSEKDADYQERLRDFIACINSIEEKNPLPKENTKFLAHGHSLLKSSDEYHKQRIHFHKCSLVELQECKHFFLTTYSDSTEQNACSIINTIFQPPSFQQTLPSAPPESHYASFI